MKIAAIVVTWNRKELLQKCIECLLNQEKASCDIVVVNNASTDGTEEMMLEKYGNNPKIKYFNSESDLGSGGFQYGEIKAMDMGYEYLWLMDDDTLPEPTALYEFLEADKELKGEWGWLSSVAYWTDGSICGMNIQKRDIFKHIGKKEYKANISPIKMCSYVSLLTRSDVIKKVGLSTIDYFIWSDDYEFTGRVSRLYPCYMVSNSKVVHAMKRNLRVDFARDSSDRMYRYHYIYRNDVHCYKQYGLYGWAYIISKDLYTCLHILINSPDNKWNKMKIVWKGFREGLKFNPKVKYYENARVENMM